MHRQRLPAQPSTIPSPGDMVDGRFQLLSVLGQGGMGTVFRARHLALGANVAVKVMNVGVDLTSDSLARFRREAQATAQLRSPHIVQVLDFGATDSFAYLAMELLDGETLASRLDARGSLSPEETYRIVRHIARALTRAHDAGVVHRDLKPDNVFLVRNDDEEIAKVVDFGIAKLLSTDGSATITQQGTVVGTPYYMSPEQARGSDSVDARTDLWSLGVIAFECLTGKRPFEAATLPDLMGRICYEPLPFASEHGCAFPGFDTWFAQACARDPSERFGSAREMADSLAQSLGVHETHSLAPTLEDRRPAGPAPLPPLVRVELVDRASGVRERARLRSTSLRWLLVPAAVVLAGALAYVSLPTSSVVPATAPSIAKEVSPTPERATTPPPSASSVPDMSSASPRTPLSQAGRTPPGPSPPWGGAPSAPSTRPPAAASVPPPKPTAGPIPTERDYGLGWAR